MKVQNITQILQNSREIIETLEQIIDENQSTQKDRETTDTDAYTAEKESVMVDRPEDMRESPESGESDSKDESMHSFEHTGKTDEERLKEIGDKEIPAPTPEDIDLLINKRASIVFSNLDITKCSKHLITFYFEDVERATIGIHRGEQEGLIDNLGYVVKIDYKEDTDNGSEFKKSSNNTKTFLSGVKDNPVEAYHCLVQHATDSKSYFL
jgi:hypothetical protein